LLLYTGDKEGSFGGSGKNSRKKKFQTKIKKVKKIKKIEIKNKGEIGIIKIIPKDLNKLFFLSSGQILFFDSI